MGKFLVDILQVKIKFRLKFFNLGSFSKYHLGLLALILMTVNAIFRIINLNILILSYNMYTLNKYNLAR